MAPRVRNDALRRREAEVADHDADRHPRIRGQHRETRPCPTEQSRDALCRSRNRSERFRLTHHEGIEARLGQDLAGAFTVDEAHRRLIPKLLSIHDNRADDGRIEAQLDNPAKRDES